MTLVPNRRPPLNGNKIWTWLLALMLCSGCAIFSPSKGKKDTGSVDVNQDKGGDLAQAPVDTIDWTITSESEVIPIGERTEEAKSIVKSSYNVVLVAPFSARDFQNRNDRLNQRMTRMLEFYAGMKYAWQTNSQDVQINLSVIDSQKDPAFADNFSSFEPILNADVIIGPYFTTELQRVAEFAKQTGKIIISPWNTGKIAQNNPYYIQLRPGLKTHAEALTKFVRSNHQNEDILLMCKDDNRDSLTLTYFHQANKRQEEGLSTSFFQEMKIENISDPDLSDTLLVRIEEQGLRTFIIPNWSDQPFIISALAKINFAKADKDVTVFGLPQWMTLSKMDYNYYENLNVHVSSTSPLTNDGRMAAALKQTYFDRYGTLPGEEAYYGMNVMNLVTQLLNKSGTLITEGLHDIDKDGNYQFEFVSVFGEDGETINHHENQFVQIVKFEEFRFVAADE